MFSISIEKISKVYKKKKVVNEVSFHVNQGEIVGLLGPNGAGKTTSFYSTVGLIKPSEGKIYCNGQDVTKLPMYQRARFGIGYLPQESSIFTHLSVEKNIIAVLETMKMTKAEKQHRLDELIAQFDVGHVRKQKGYTLSGGERRRVEIARALAANPRILLLDEPFAGVDPIAVKDIQSVIKDIQSMNLGILITDHNVRETLKIVSRAYIMNKGQILIKGTAEELINNEEARRIYLGDDFTL